MMETPSLETAITDEIGRLVTQGYKKLCGLGAEVQAYTRSIGDRTFAFETRIEHEEGKVYVLVEASRNSFPWYFFGIQRAFSLSARGKHELIPLDRFYR